MTKIVKKNVKIGKIVRICKKKCQKIYNFFKIVKNLSRMSKIVKIVRICKKNMSKNVKNYPDVSKLLKKMSNCQTLPMLSNMIHHYPFQFDHHHIIDDDETDPVHG